MQLVCGYNFILILWIVISFIANFVQPSDSTMLADGYATQLTVSTSRSLQESASCDKAMATSGWCRAVPLNYFYFSGKGKWLWLEWSDGMKESDMPADTAYQYVGVQQI